MNFFYYFPGRWLPLNEEFMSGSVHRDLAIAAEKAGFYGVCVDEHPAPVKSWLEGPGGHHAFDPFVCLAAIAGVTTKLRLLTYLTVVPFRHPFLFTKTATTLDVMSDGRLTLGVGIGYMKGEFDAQAIDFDRRNELFMQTMDIFRQACSGEPVDMFGPMATDDKVVILPRPVQRPHPPLWIGGTTKISRRRAVDFGQGWMPTPRARNHAYHKVPPLENADDLREMITWMNDYKDEVGRVAPLDIVITFDKMIDTTASIAGQIEQIRELESLGVTGFTLSPRSQTIPQSFEWIEEFRETFIDPLSN